MKKIKTWWKARTKMEKAEVIIALIATIGFTMQVPTVWAWFSNKHEAARFERIDSPNTLFITAAQREDAINLVMDDINIKGEWIGPDGQAIPMTYQDYVFSVTGERVDTFTLQLAHTTNNQYQYEIFLADTDKRTVAPENTEVEGRDYTAYTVTNEYPNEMPITEDNIAANTVLYYRIKKNNNNLPMTLNKNVKTKDGNATETNGYDPSDSNKKFNGEYKNGTDGGVANTSLRSQSYDNYTNVEEHANALYWQCTDIPGESSTSNEPFYVEFILRVYFNDNSTAFKDTDIVYITASGI